MIMLSTAIGNIVLKIPIALLLLSPSDQDFAHEGEVKVQM